MDGKQYITRILSWFFCLLCMVAFFNYRMDPGNIFGNNRLIEDCGNWLLAGHDVAIMENFDERLLQKYLIEHDSESYDVLVFGSSRSMGIGQDLFPGFTMKNYSVSGASLEDDIALYFLYERLHGKPRKIVICADAWLLNQHNGQTRWKSIAEEYSYGIEKMTGTALRIEGIGFDKYFQLISWPYFRESINKAKKFLGDSGYRLADERGEVPLNAGIICPDGSHIPSAKEQAKDAEPEARKYIAGNVYSLERYDALDEDLRTKLQEFLSYLNGEGVIVELFLTPYHPLVYTYFARTEKYMRVLEAEEYFRKLAIDKRFSIVGSYDPKQCGLSSVDFTDGMHLRRESVYRILRGAL